MTERTSTPGPAIAPTTEPQTFVVATTVSVRPPAGVGVHGAASSDPDPHPATISSAARRAATRVPRVVRARAGTGRLLAGRASIGTANDNRCRLRGGGWVRALVPLLLGVSP